MKYSNCLLEAMKTFFRSPLQIKIHACKTGGVPHFFWFNKESGKYYHFRAIDKDLPTWKIIWFEGNIEEMYPGKP